MRVLRTKVEQSSSGTASRLRTAAKGYATEAATALVAHARRAAGVAVIRAHTMPEHNASARVLSKCGFVKVGELMDPEDGLIWRWEKG